MITGQYSFNLSEAKQKSTLINLNIESLKIGKVHKVWDSLESTVWDVRKGIINFRKIDISLVSQ